MKNTTKNISFYSLILFLCIFSSCKESQPQTAVPTVKEKSKTTYTKDLKPANKAEESPRTRDAYISIGDSKEKVISLLNEPVNQESDPAQGREALVFDDGVIMLSNGKVNGWNNYADKLPVHVFTDNSSIKENNSINMGSTMEEALQIYGTPNSIKMQASGKSHIAYGVDKLSYDNNKLTTYYNDSGFFNIKFKINNTGAKAFTAGSSTMDVLSCQGVPSRISKLKNYSMWKYGKSFVMFDNAGFVTKWQNSSNNLRTY